MLFKLWLQLRRSPVGSEGVECVVVVGGAESFKHYAAAAGVRSHKYFSVIFALSFALILALYLAIC